MDRSNDPRECLSRDYAAAQTAVFASCWTDSGNENRAMWEMYQCLDGVRIGLPTLMFNGRRNNHKVTSDDRLYEIHVDQAVPGESICQIERRGARAHLLSSPNVSGPTRIRYLDDEELLYTTNSVMTDGGAHFDVREIGTLKHSSFRYEEEVRYRIFAIFPYATPDWPTAWMSPSAIEESPVVTPFVDIPLDRSIFGEMEITVGPNATRSQWQEVESLCRRFAPAAKIAASVVRTRDAKRS